MGIHIVPDDVYGFEIAQKLRALHCDRKDIDPDHTCVGVMTVSRGKVDLNCTLCGKCDVTMPGWNLKAVEHLRQYFLAAGIKWDSLDIKAQYAAIRKWVEVNQTHE